MVKTRSHPAIERPLLKNSARWFFAFFFFSGFCGLVYQIVWLRLAYADFGVNTQVLSMVLSVFMTGLGLGSWWGGRWAERARRRFSPLALYALAEGLIGLGAFAVPFLFHWGQQRLLALGGMDSGIYFLGSGLVLLAALLPWCLCMGATYPLVMAALRGNPSFSNQTFGFLYASNVAGAMAGVLFSSLILIEWLGFQGTLTLTACFNFLISLSALGLTRGFKKPRLNPGSSVQRKAAPGRDEGALGLLALTGFLAMALEVVWTRAFTTVLKTQVYSFAALLFTYLLATVIGSAMYRRDLRGGKPLSTSRLLSYASVLILLPVVLNDPRLHHSAIGILASLTPFCAILGYLTPKLVDAYSAGRPEMAGRAYAANIAGCVAGPLAASYGLLPWMGSKTAMIVLGVPLIFFPLRDLLAWKKAELRQALLGSLAAVALLLQACLGTVSYEDALGFFFPNHQIHRDYTATVEAAENKGEEYLFVNGINMTGLTPVTKFMAHLPLVFHQGPAHSALDICFGMGTTFRSLLSWGLDTTVVDLNRGVFQSFPFFYSDAKDCRLNPLAHFVVDDGRRFLERSPQKFDLITIDPPPPIEAAGSSLLYSTEFYRLAKSHLNPGGILQQWYPGDASPTLEAVTRSLTLSFRYVRMYRSICSWGCHFIASDSPLPPPTVDQWLSKMPAKARADMMELYPASIPARKVAQVQLGRELSVQNYLGDDPGRLVRDDKPYNEYYLTRRFFAFLQNNQGASQ